jgi:hypothetical protein
LISENHRVSSTNGIYRKFVLTVKQTHRLTDDQIGESVGSKSHRTRKVNVSVFAVCENTDSQIDRNPGQTDA